MKKSIIAAIGVLTAIIVAAVPVTAFAKAIPEGKTQITVDMSEEKAETQNSVTSGVTGDKALEIALKDASYDKEDTLYAEVKKARDAGMEVYHVEFRVGFAEHFYEISVVDGEILDCIVND